MPYFDPSEMTALAGEIVTLRTHISNGPNADEALRVKCTQLAIEQYFLD